MELLIVSHFHKEWREYSSSDHKYWLVKLLLNDSTDVVIKNVWYGDKKLKSFHFSRGPKMQRLSDAYLSCLCCYSFHKYTFRIDCIDNGFVDIR